MRSQFDRVSDASITNVIADQWKLEIEQLTYLPVGAGAYHWIADAKDKQRYFVTGDDLDTKPWLGPDRDTVFDGLLSAYSTASQLRAAGLGFVVAPIVACSGAPAVRIDERHSLAVFEHVDGEPGQWGSSLGPGARVELIRKLATLHQTPATNHVIVERPFHVPGRDGLEEAIADLHRPWNSGPLSEPARRQLAGHVDLVGHLMDEVDRYAARSTAAKSRLVVTHGEPHPGNLILTATGLVMVDWDTVAIAEPERDLWMLDDAVLLDAYQDLTGVVIDREALAAHRLMWALTDLAAYTVQLRAEHQHDADADRALAALHSILDGSEPSPYGTSD